MTDRSASPPPARLGRRVLLSLPLALPALAHAAPAMLAPGVAMPLRLAAGAAQDFGLQLAAGDYVAGLLERPHDVLAEGAALELWDAAGETLLRQLALPGNGPFAFQFVASGNGGVRLRLLAAAESEVRLSVERILPLAAQVAPDPARQPLDSPRLEALRQRLLAGDTAALDAFWSEVAAAGTPLLEPLPSGALASFLWRGTLTTRGVRLLGGPIPDQPPLQRLGQSDLWFLSVAVPPGTRLSYQIAPDVPELPDDAATRRNAVQATAQADPLNPRRWPPDPRRDRFTASSVLELPDAPQSPWLAPRPGVPAGAVRRHRFASPRLGNERLLALYTPAHTGTAALPLLVLFDAEAYLDIVPTPVILDNLIAAGAIPPVAALFVGNGPGDARDRELPPNPAFAAELVQHILPWAQGQVRLSDDPAQRVVAGASYGGIAAAFAALRYPEVFGNVLSQSGSFGWAPEGAASPEWLIAQYAAAPMAAERSGGRPVQRFYLEAGSFERGRPGRLGPFDTTRHMALLLQAKGYAVQHREWSAGHDYISWRMTLPAGLIHLFQG